MIGFLPVCFFEDSTPDLSTDWTVVGGSLTATAIASDDQYNRSESVNLGFAQMGTAGDTDKVFEQRWAYLFYRYVPTQSTASTYAFIAKAVVPVCSIALIQMTTFLPTLSKATPGHFFTVHIMDGLSAAASVAAIVDVSAKVASLRFQYSVAVKDAKKDIDRLQRTITSLMSRMSSKKLNIY
ncbi:MAG: hypothetical protein M1813_007227 [Trichoglossum hirsutum]|nr:MAG: hypothetical protein M1813_007227 [Trichoglossum hirsutum]